MSKTRIEDRLAVNKYDVDDTVHITIDGDVCALCSHYNCTYACPAGCYRYADGRLIFSYEGCLECGSCQIVCNRNAIRWVLPRAGLGIMYQFG